MNGQERAKTRPDGNDPKEFRGPPFLSSFLFSLLQFATSSSSSFPHTFSPLAPPPSLPPTYRGPDLSLSFFLFLTWTNASALRQRTRSGTRLKRVLTAMTSKFFSPPFSPAPPISLPYYYHDSPLFAFRRRRFIFAHSPL